MPTKALIGSILRWILATVFAGSLLAGILPDNWLAYLRSDTGLKMLIDTVLGIGGLLWGLYVQLSHHKGLALADTKEAGHGVENIKAEAAQIGFVDTVKVGLNRKDVSDVKTTSVSNLGPDMEDQRKEQ